MTPEQIEEFEQLRDLIGEALENGYESPITTMFHDLVVGYDEDTWISEDDNYFYGDIGHANYEVVEDFLSRNKLEEKSVLEG